MTEMSEDSLFENSKIENTGHILVVDDNKINRMMLKKMLTNEGHRVTEAEDGIQALEYLENEAGESVDVILLDILMPELDGYQLLEKIKQHPKIHYLPVIMISALDELDSVVRCIEIGATDYLTKPVQRTLLRARLNSSLAEKRLRDLEIEYLEQVGHVIGAAEAVQTNDYQPESLNSVASRVDALGNLARVFQRMAQEVHLREQRLKQQLEQLRLDVEEMKRALEEPLSVYLPMDRRHALIREEILPDRTTGSALFADISGFTPLTNAFTVELGQTRGAEELTRLINQVLDALVEEVHFYKGSVISFSGDAITCWFDGDDGMRGIACAVLLQLAMMRFETTITKLAGPTPLSIKVAVAAGPVRRFLLGDPTYHVIEAIAGHKLDILAMAEKLSHKGEIIVEGSLAEKHIEALDIVEWRTAETSESFAVISGLKKPVFPTPWPEISTEALTQEVCRSWIHPAVFEQVKSSARQFLAGLRPAAALFLQFEGIDYDNDQAADIKLDAFVRWVQGIVARYEGTLLQFTFGDKGSYLYTSFGAPIAHQDDSARAVRAAFELISLPKELGFIHGIQIGITYGQMRTGAYGSSSHRTYGVMGNRVNLAARLMQKAEGQILCDEPTFQATQNLIHYEILTPIKVKGREGPFAVYRPLSEKSGDATTLAALISQVDQLSPPKQMALKAASVIGSTFELRLLSEIFPMENEKTQLPDFLLALVQANLIAEEQPGVQYQFQHPDLQDTVYNSMLFVQRRQLHRHAAEWLEKEFASDLDPHYEIIGYHWKRAEEPTKAIYYLEKAGQNALLRGDHEKAEQLFQECLILNEKAAVLSSEFELPS